MKITRNSLNTVRGPADQSTGDVYIDRIANPSDASQLGAAVVHFSPGARTAWHTGILGYGRRGLMRGAVIHAPRATPERAKGRCCASQKRTAPPRVLANGATGRMGRRRGCRIWGRRSRRPGDRMTTSRLR
jgi:hypothetical protein